MKLWWVLSLCVVALAIAENELPLAESCDEEACKLPDCRCSSTRIPGGLEARDTPQFVLLTFDDAVNVINIETYRKILNNRTNRNGCPISATFYISHEYNNYQLTNELYNNNHEISLHSITHQIPQSYWQSATAEDMRREFGDQKRQMAHFANIPESAIKGLRIPFLQMTGNSTFEIMSEYGLQYDCSWPTQTFMNPGLWPYTLDYASTQDCPIPPCPSASIPGAWVVPMVSWRDLTGNVCSMVDGCFSVPNLDDEDGWFRLIVNNFERHYLGNRSPFGFYIHEWAVSSRPGLEKALVRFMDMLNNLPDAFMVKTSEVVDWVKNPVPVNEYAAQTCTRNTPTFCRATSCGPLYAEHRETDMYIQICNTCPKTYPWRYNPLGV